jgi:hypothetical protein
MSTVINVYTYATNVVAVPFEEVYRVFLRQEYRLAHVDKNAAALMPQDVVF